MARIMLENVRLSYPKLFTAEQFNGTGPFAWSASFLLDPKNASHAAQIANLEEVMAAEFRKKCNPKNEEDFQKKYGLLSWDEKCLRDGVHKEESDGYAGMKFVAARATQGTHAAPLVLTRKRIKVEAAGAEGAPYGGCFVNAQLDVYGQYGTYKRVNAVLLGVQFVRDGDAFGAGAPADPDAFADLGDTGDDFEDVSDLA